jgi:hypothetical protein
MPKSGHEKNEKKTPRFGHGKFPTYGKLRNQNQGSVSPIQECKGKDRGFWVLVVFAKPKTPPQNNTIIRKEIIMRKKEAENIVNFIDTYLKLNESGSKKIVFFDHKGTGCFDDYVSGIKIVRVEAAFDSEHDEWYLFGFTEDGERKLLHEAVIYTASVVYDSRQDKDK